jgi:hypothetical protein
VVNPRPDSVAIRAGSAAMGCFPSVACPDERISGACRSVASGTAYRVLRFIVIPALNYKSSQYAIAST